MVENKKTNKVSIAANTRQYKAKIRRLVISALGGKCVRCGFSDWRALQIDHINHVGSKNHEGWLTQAKKILSGDYSNYQLLCANCNWIKKHEEREFYIIHYELEEKKY